MDQYSHSSNGMQLIRCEARRSIPLTAPTFCVAARVEDTLQAEPDLVVVRRNGSHIPAAATRQENGTLS